MAKNTTAALGGIGTKLFGGGSGPSVEEEQKRLREQQKQIARQELDKAAQDQANLENAAAAGAQKVRPVSPVLAEDDEQRRKFLKRVTA
ncbi:hypothetical protein UFOVP354_20 [uncultured Caudovirales phage]|uniref:Uncharacterized protein n=1 Tax=uncultured Caudovirales phage TaxID=2100421 RepID=A0A6J5M0V7_9CAUD|nr:hypothetical protein UFOVP354_20 [uncultured Caudovirales phage]